MSKTPTHNYVQADSPFEENPGFVRFDRIISAQKYVQYFKSLPEKANDVSEEEKSLPFFINNLKRRAIFVQECTIEGFDPADPENAPNFSLVVWLNIVIGNHINEAGDPKNWPGVPQPPSAETSTPTSSGRKA